MFAFLHFVFFLLNLTMAARVLPYACRASSQHLARFCSSPLRNPIAVTRTFHAAASRYEQQANVKVKRDPAPKIVRSDSKLFKDADSAVADLQNGSTILSAGFGLCGTAGRIAPDYFTYQ